MTMLPGREGCGGCTYVGSSGMFTCNYICLLNNNREHNWITYGDQPFAFVVYRATMSRKTWPTSRDFHDEMLT